MRSRFQINLFYLNDNFMLERLDFLCLTETWQRVSDHTPLIELCPPDCSVLSTPRLSGRGGEGLALVHQDAFPCTKLSSDSFSSFEHQMSKVGSNPLFYCFLIYRPPGLARVFLDEFAEFL